MGQGMLANRPESTGGRSAAPINTSSSTMRGSGPYGVVGDVLKVNEIDDDLIIVTTSGDTYTVDTSSAEIKDGVDIIDLADIKIGDRVAIHGQVNGHDIVAVLVLDNVPSKPHNKQGQKISNNSFSDQTVTLNEQKVNHSFLGRMVGWFAQTLGWGE